MAKSIVALFGGKDGVDILLDVMKHQETELELSALALQYFLHIAGDHSEHLNDAAKLTFQDEIIPSLLNYELTKELLIETYHRYGVTCCEPIDDVLLIVTMLCCVAARKFYRMSLLRRLRSASPHYCRASRYERNHIANKMDKILTTVVLLQVANCLRVSSLFENVCAISILRVISHHFVPMSVKRGETFAAEGDIGNLVLVSPRIDPKH